MFRLFLGFALLTGTAFAEEGLPLVTTPLTLIVESEKPLAPQALSEMRLELDRIVSGSNLRIDWRLRDDLKSGESVSDLIVVKFHGACRMQWEPAVSDGRGPLAFTHSSNGEILPFSEVSCDKVRGLARSAMTFADLARGDMLMGRALARVLAHEVYHILSRQQKHSSTGLFKRSLTGSQLIAEEYRFSDKDLHRLVVAR